MSALKILLASISFFTLSKSFAKLDPLPTEDFTAQFKIAHIDKAMSYCTMTEDMMPPAQALQFEQKGCVLELEVIKLKQGHLPKEPLHIPQKGRYDIYDPGPLCKKKVGDELTEHIETSETTCSDYLDNHKGWTMETCTLGPNPKPLDPPSDQYLQCHNARWEIVPH